MTEQDASKPEHRIHATAVDERQDRWAAIGPSFSGLGIDLNVVPPSEIEQGLQGTALAFVALASSRRRTLTSLRRTLHRARGRTGFVACLDDESSEARERVLNVGFDELALEPLDFALLVATATVALIASALRVHALDLGDTASRKRMAAGLRCRLAALAHARRLAPRALERLVRRLDGEPESQTMRAMSIRRSTACTYDRQISDRMGVRTRAEDARLVLDLLGCGPLAAFGPEPKSEVKGAPSARRRR